MSTKAQLKKLEKIENLTHELGGVRYKYLKSEKYLKDNFTKFGLKRIFKRKDIIKKRAKKMRKIAKRLSRLGVFIDLEQR
jgi:hypothetical protein